MRVAFLGLGAMGQGMVLNLVKAGHTVRVWNRTPPDAPALAAQGLAVAATIADAVGDAEVVCTMLADDAALREVVHGSDSAPGILSAMARDAVHASLGTISTDLSARVARAHGDAGQMFVAAPVFGRPDAAAAARLTIVAAGPDAAITRVRPVLEALGQKLFVVGAEPPMANVVKLGGNFLIAAMIEALGEAFALMRKSGIPTELFLEIVNGNLFRSPVYENYGRLIASERFEPAGFRLRLGLKDVRLVLAAAELATVPMPLASLVRDHLLTAVAQGKGDLDWSALARLAADNAGVP